MNNRITHGLFLLTTFFTVIGCAATPPIVDDQGKPVSDSIASLETVQWRDNTFRILVRGHDADAPIMLWLAGGPGGSELGWTRAILHPLERDVVFVNWEQPGVGRMYGTVDWNTVTVRDYVNATISLSEYLIERFGREKIILAGHSWGSIIGLKAVDRRPDLFHAYLAIAQQVNADENDLHGYDLVLRAAKRSGHRRVVRRLKEMGPPPYSPSDGANYLYLFQKVHVYSPAPSDAFGDGQEFQRDPGLGAMLFPREYALQDTVGAIRGLLAGVTHVYPQLSKLDFEREIPELSVPIYFFTGRYDETCVQDITRRYYEAVQAPRKAFFWFERSGHNVPFQEPQRFIELIRNRVIPENIQRKREGE